MLADYTVRELATQSVAVRREDFGGEVGAGPQEADQPGSDEVVQLDVHQGLQRAARHQEGLHPVLGEQNGTLDSGHNTHRYYFSIT